MATETDNTIHFELVSPERKLMSEPVKMVVVPGSEGEMGIKRLHASVLTTLKPGVIRIYRADEDKPETIFVSSGFADVAAGNCTVLAEDAVLLADLDARTLEKTIADLEDDRKLADSDDERNQIDRRLLIAREQHRALQTEAA